jgi:hypothetical protein
MNKQQALTIVDQAVSLAPLTRQQHQQVIEALKVLGEEDKAKKKD